MDRRPNAGYGGQLLNARGESGDAALAQRHCPATTLADHQCGAESEFRAGTPPKMRSLPAQRLGPDPG